MEVRVCPKCKAQNRSTSAACSNCYSSLESVPVTEGTAPQMSAPVAPRPPRTATPTAAPTQQMGAPPQAQQMGVPPQTQMGVAAPPPGRPLPPGAYQTAPKSKSPVGIILVVLFIALAAVGGLAFAVMKSGFFKPDAPPTESPQKVMLAFLEAKKTEDLTKVEPYLSENSKNIIKNTLSSKQAQSAGFTSKDSANMVLWSMTPTSEEMRDTQIVVNEMKGDRDADQHTAIVNVMVQAAPEPAQAPKPLLPPGQTPPPEPEKKVDLSKFFHSEPVEVQYVLIAEGGKWKIDVDDTKRRALGLGKRESLFHIGK